MGFWSDMFGGKKSKIEWLSPPPYTGEYPYSGEEVGYGSKEMKGLASAYLPELQKRAMGQGLVGFDPAYRDTLRKEYMTDWQDLYKDTMDQTSGQASGQGLRGGVPMSIASERIKDLTRAREAGLADIDIRDLEARREDINKAFYQQPEEITRGAGIQEARAKFDLAKYAETMPYPYEVPGQDSIFSQFAGPLGDATGIPGAGIGLSMLAGSMNKGPSSRGGISSSVNKSMGGDENSISSMLRRFLQEQKAQGRTS